MSGFYSVLLISNEAGYENPEWLMQTRAPDRGRDLSVTRTTTDALSGTLRHRVVIQCKHWQTKSVSLQDAALAKEQMARGPIHESMSLSLQRAGVSLKAPLSGLKNTIQRVFIPGSKCGQRAI